ncbi:isochorismate synthase [Actinorugispora endophytica]|uniref:isochorismate synthase n=1 Tax=Actinorugispora endophytica TaxID=1605990 RepID=A0A4R6V0X0_9ACTN|nr:isochorismate synthase [Actinorugispora endophytica]TDQ53403.1 isochorismate synthase [Actinorugispora endophytica]
MSPAAASREPLLVRTVELPDDHALLDRLPDSAPLAWSRRGEGLVAWGRAARLELPAEDERSGGGRFAAAAEWLGSLFSRVEAHDEVELPGTGPVVFGSFTFDGRDPGSTVVLPRVVVGRRAGRAWMTTVDDASAPVGAGGPARPVGGLRWSPGALGAGEWTGAVAAAVDRIRAGDLAKVVLARDAVAEAPGPIDIRTPLARLARDYPDCYTYSVAGLTGATPELLLRRAGERMESLVLAGTRPRGGTPEEDAALAATLLASVKDTEEHAYATESLRAALGPLCGELVLPERPELLRLANVQHLASPVRATLRPGVSTLDAVAALHPTAAVGGTPTPLAMDVIGELEGMRRGRYAGPVGWMDADGNGEWGIALRCAQIDGARARLFAGCGIVAGSDPEAELAESESKFGAMRAALLD